MVSYGWSSEQSHLFILLEQSKVMETRAGGGNNLMFQVLKEITSLWKSNKHVNFLQKLCIWKHPCRHQSGFGFLLSLFSVVQSEKFNYLIKYFFHITNCFRFTEPYTADRCLESCAFSFLFQQLLVYCQNRAFWPMCFLGCSFPETEHKIVKKHQTTQMLLGKFCRLKECLICDKIRILVLLKWHSLFKTI